MGTVVTSGGDRSSRIERRAHPRQPWWCPVRLVINAYSIDQRVIDGTVHNVSAGGAMIVVAHDGLARDQTCLIEFIGVPGKLAPDRTTGKIRRATRTDRDDFVLRVQFDHEVTLLDSTNSAFGA